MRISSGNLWDYHKKGKWVVIPTNGVTNAKGDAVLGAGIARQARLRFPSLPRLLGEHIREHGTDVMCLPEFRLYALPTKYHWQSGASLALIRKGCDRLRALSAGTVVLPRLGCGRGGLEWSVVGPVMSEVLKDSRFLVLA